MRFPARLQLCVRQDPLRAASPVARDPMPASKIVSRTVPGHAPPRATARPPGTPALRVLPHVHAILEPEEMRQAAPRHAPAPATAPGRARLHALRRDIRAGCL